MANRYQIRKALPDDIPGVVAIERRCFSDPWSASSFQASIRGLGLVAAAGQRVLGYAFAVRAGDQAEIVNVAVDPDRQREGIGRALIEETLGRLGEEGVRNIYLEVRSSNAAARKLYAHFGFTAVGARPNYYRRPQEDAVVMARSAPGFGTMRKKGPNRVSSVDKRT